MSDGGKILFVDDQKEILDLLVRLFGREGIQLHTATHAEDAMQIASRCPIDLVLSDSELPDGSGEELLNRIKEVKPEAVRILSSSFLDVRFGEIGVDTGDGTLYLSKPWDPFVLRHLIIQRLNPAERTNA